MCPFFHRRTKYLLLRQQAKIKLLLPFHSDHKPAHPFLWLHTNYHRYQMLNYLLHWYHCSLGCAASTTFVYLLKIHHSEIGIFINGNRFVFYPVSDASTIRNVLISPGQRYRIISSKHLTISSIFPMIG